MNTRDITMIAILIAILVVVQFAFSIVVGINLVFPLIIIFTYNLGLKRSMVITLTFVLVRFLMGLPFLVVILWGWTFTILVLLAHITNKLSKGNEYVAAAFTLFYFILFGYLCGVQEYILTDVPVIAYWLRGLPTDILGGITGFITTLVLLKPISSVIHHTFLNGITRFN